MISVASLMKNNHFILRIAIASFALSLGFLSLAFKGAVVSSKACNKDKTREKETHYQPSDQEDCLTFTI